jgi:hypothetical protein
VVTTAIDVAPSTSRSGLRTRDRSASTRRGLLVPLALFGASRGLLGLLTWIVPLQPGQTALGRLGRLVDVADAQWYMRVAVDGYAHVPLATALATGAPKDWVFFPLFPVTARLVADASGAPALWTGVVISNVSFFVFAVVLYRWVARDWDRRAATIATALACFCPLTPYFVGFRAASMFLALSAVSLERLSRRKMGQAAAAGSLASLARPAGLLLVVPFLLVVVLLVRARASRRGGLGALGLTPLFGLGVGVMAWISGRDAGTPLAFVRDQVAWGRALRPPFAAFVPFVRHPVWETGFGWTSPPIALAATALGIFAVAWLVRRRSRPEAWAYLLATVLGATASTVLLGLPRFIAESPPLYVAGGLTSKRIGRAVVAASAGLMVGYSVFWLLGAPWTMA